ncbi:MAG TPA: SGNH/GDSL hydrolase family protein [Fimbriimonadaceae bacterium]|nr:SGNH/GDSL hydrolase family protein [Fimbriimonadaceae bacterium]
MIRCRLPVFVVFVALAATAVVSAQTRTYIALGDSVSWGYQPNDTARGAGDKGFVRPFADWLGTRQGGVRPRVINLSIPGETSSSFFDTTEVGYLLNSNYPLLFRSSQSSTFGSRVTNEFAAGRTITHVTYALGGNDMLDLLTSSFLTLPFAQQTATVDQTLLTTDAKIVQALTLVRQRLPGAILIVPGYYNPYAADPNSAEQRIALYALPRLNLLLATRARQFGCYFAPTYADFLGQELAWTWIGDNDIHPRQAGYDAIGRRVILTATKIPSRAP